MAEGARKRESALPAARCIRPLLEVLAPVQSDGRTRRDFHNGTRRLDGAGPRSGLPDRSVISGTNWWWQGSRGACMKAQGKKVEERRAEVLIEIGCEEIPAGMLPRAEEDLRAGIEKRLTAGNMADRGPGGT